MINLLSNLLFYSNDLMIFSELKNSRWFQWCVNWSWSIYSIEKRVPIRNWSFDTYSLIVIILQLLHYTQQLIYLFQMFENMSLIFPYLDSELKVIKWSHQWLISQLPTASPTQWIGMIRRWSAKNYKSAIIASCTYLWYISGKRTKDI